MLAREGVRFGLDDDTFKRWWNTAITPEDAAEFVHLHCGSIDDARFVCALDQLTTDAQGCATSDLIITAYIISRNMPEGDKGLSHVKIEAQAVYESEQVKMLIDALRARHNRQARARVEAMTVARIEGLYDRIKKDDFEDHEERLNTEKVFLDASVRFLGVAQKERAQEKDRRDKAAIRRAMEQNQQNQRMIHAAPSGPEAKLALEMLREQLGPEQFAEVISQFVPQSIAD